MFDNDSSFFFVSKNDEFPNLMPVVVLGGLGVCEPIPSNRI